MNIRDNTISKFYPTWVFHPPFEDMDENAGRIIEKIFMATQKPEPNHVAGLLATISYRFGIDDYALTIEALLTNKNFMNLYTYGSYFGKSSDLKDDSDQFAPCFEELLDAFFLKFQHKQYVNHFYVKLAEALKDCFGLEVPSSILKKFQNQLVVLKALGAESKAKAENDKKIEADAVASEVTDEKSAVNISSNPNHLFAVDSADMKAEMSTSKIKLDGMVFEYVPDGTTWNAENISVFLIGESSVNLINMRSNLKILDDSIKKDLDDDTYSALLELAYKQYKPIDPLKAHP